MSLLQRFLMAVLPKRWMESIRAESQLWKIRCPKCGAARSYWDIGGIRWKAYSRGKRMLSRCPKCGKIGWAIVEKVAAP